MSQIVIPNLGLFLSLSEKVLFN